MENNCYNILLTGCAGVIGSHAAECFVKDKRYLVAGVDKMTYASDQKNIKMLSNYDNFNFYKGDICDKMLIENIVKKYNIRWIINFAAETHVDNSIEDATDFLKSNFLGVHNLLEICKNKKIKLFQISTDEVYGEAKEYSYKENNMLDPRNPYSASKAAAEHLINSYANTYQVEYIIARPSNNYGPRQHKEKFIPKILMNLKNRKKVPVYGSGLQIREWTYVKDTVNAIKFILEHSDLNECYNISSNIEMKNLEVLDLICEKTNNDASKVIKFVKDRKGHDNRYSINSDKLNKLGYKNYLDFKSGLNNTIKYYLEKK